MKKHLNLIFSLLILTALLILPYFVFAQTAPSSEISPMAARLNTVAGGGGYSTGENAGLFTIIGTIISAVLGLLGVIFVILIVYAGFEWMTAAGNETKIEKATATIKHTVIGLIITLSSWAIWEFIFWNFIMK